MKWNEENVGRSTYSLIPEFGTKVTFPKKGEEGKLVYLTAGSYCMTLCSMMMHSEQELQTFVCVNVVRKKKLSSMCYKDVLNIFLEGML